MSSPEGLHPVFKELDQSKDIYETERQFDEHDSFNFALQQFLYDQSDSIEMQSTGRLITPLKNGMLVSTFCSPKIGEFVDITHGFLSPDIGEADFVVEFMDTYDGTPRTTALSLGNDGTTTLPHVKDRLKHARRAIGHELITRSGERVPENAQPFFNLQNQVLALTGKLFVEGEALPSDVYELRRLILTTMQNSETEIETRFDLAWGFDDSSSPSEKLPIKISGLCISNSANGAVINPLLRYCEELDNQAEPEPQLEAHVQLPSSAVYFGGDHTVLVSYRLAHSGQWHIVITSQESGEEQYNSLTHQDANYEVKLFKVLAETLTTQTP